jgi:hypothetical protein
LLDARVTVQAHDRRIRQVGQSLADTLGPRSIDTAEICEWVSSQTVDQLSRRAAENQRLGPQRTLRDRRRRRNGA